MVMNEVLSEAIKTSDIIPLKPEHMYDKPAKVVGKPHEVKGDIPTTFVELETIIDKLKSDIHKAATEIVGQVTLPSQVDIYSIKIPILHITEMGKNAKSCIAERPHVNISVMV